MLKRIIVIIVGILCMNISAQSGEFSISGLLKWYSGNYMYRELTNTTYLYPTLGYRSAKYFVSLNLPLISQNSDLITHMGGKGVIPSQENYGSSSFNESQDHGMFSDNHMDNHRMNWAIGDLYFNFERTMFNETGYIPNFFSSFAISKIVFTIVSGFKDIEPIPHSTTN